MPPAARVVLLVSRHNAVAVRRICRTIMHAPADKQTLTLLKRICQERLLTTASVYQMQLSFEGWLVDDIES